MVCSYLLDFCLVVDGNKKNLLPSLSDNYQICTENSSSFFHDLEDVDDFSSILRGLCVLNFFQLQFYGGANVFCFLISLSLLLWHLCFRNYSEIIQHSFQFQVFIVYIPNYLVMLGHLFWPGSGKRYFVACFGESFSLFSRHTLHLLLPLLCSSLCKCTCTDTNIAFT